MNHFCSVISAYVILKKFTPGLQKIYTDISAISATFSNSGLSLLLKLFNTKGYFTCSLVPVCDRMEGQPPLHSTQQGSAIGKQRVEIWKIFLG